MSIEAIHWVLTAAPIPRQQRDASTLTVVLIGLANHACPDGTNAFPSVATLTHYTRLSTRSVQASLRKLENLGLIAPSDPDIVAAHIRRADRRPQGWDLALHRHESRGAPAPPSDWRTLAPGPGVIHSGGRLCTPLAPTGCSQRPTGCSQRRHGVHPLHPNRP